MSTFPSTSALQPSVSRTVYDVLWPKAKPDTTSDAASKQNSEHFNSSRQAPGAHTKESSRASSAPTAGYRASGYTVRYYHGGASYTAKSGVMDQFSGHEKARVSFIGRPIETTLILASNPDGTVDESRASILVPDPDSVGTKVGHMMSIKELGSGVFTFLPSKGFATFGGDLDHPERIQGAEKWKALGAFQYGPPGDIFIQPI